MYERGTGAGKSWILLTGVRLFDLPITAEKIFKAKGK